MIKVNDKWLRLLLPAVPSGIILYFLLMDGRQMLPYAAIAILTAILVCEGGRFLIYRSRTWFSPPYKKLKRLVALVPSGIALLAVLFFLSKGARNYIAYGELDAAANPGVFSFEVNHKPAGTGLLASSLLYGLLSFLVLLAIYETAYYFARLRHIERDRDRLEKEKLQAELQQLKGIVNPHFLFNNLNSLSSLISESPPQAEAFLDELTKVFRYLLRTNEMVLTTLQQELQFMESYYHLLQTRYGKAISMQVRVDAAREAWLLPPLTLQLLVENAVKHNRLQKENPLRIELFTEAGDRLVVRNNLAVRERGVDSTGIGLRSINSRYQLLNHPAPAIEKDAAFFSVYIPLIAPA